MHDEFPFLQDLAVVVLVAGVVTVVFHRLRQPVVLGYILAGLIVGPHTIIPLSVSDTHTVNMMSQLGVILLMFSLGLHFSLRKLAQVGGTALIAATLEIVLMVLIGYAVGRAFGWSVMDSVFLGAILSISSTTIIIKALQDLGLTKQRFAQLVFGILIVEDILAIAMLALLSGVAVTGSLAAGDVLETLWKLGVFLTSVLVVGLLVVPRLLRYVNRFKSNEMLLITALGLCFGVSLLALKLGYSVALGAFLIGAVVAEARERGKIEGLVEPVRDLFSAVFFVAVGMLIDPRVLLDYAVPIFVITIAVVIGKVLTCSLGTFLAGHDPKTALKVGMGLAQIGEFSFIIAGLGLSLNVTSEFLYPIAVTVSAVTTLLTPYLIRMSDAVANGLSRVAPATLSGYVQVYSRWMVARGEHSPAAGGAASGAATAAAAAAAGPGRRDRAQVRRLLRRWIFQIVLNGLLAAAVLLAASAGGRRLHEQWPGMAERLPRWTGGADALLWLAAMLLVLPLLIVTYRKLRATALVLAEASVPRATAGAQTEAVRGVMSATIITAGSLAIGVTILLLSATILPPWPMLVLLAGVVCVVAATMWRRFERLYARGQAALVETLTRPAEVPPPPAVPLPTVLQQAEMDAVEILPGSAAAGRLIRELQLRTRSGASAVGIERAGGAAVVNPGPDEELLPGDRVVLLGSRPQLEAARSLLIPAPVSPGIRGAAQPTPGDPQPAGASANSAGVAGLPLGGAPVLSTAEEAR